MGCCMEICSSSSAVMLIRIGFVARHDAELTMKALGDRIGISQAQISQIEAGLSAPSMTTLFRLVKAMKVKMGELFNGM